MGSFLDKPITEKETIEGGAHGLHWGELSPFLSLHLPLARSLSVSLLVALPPPPPSHHSVSTADSTATLSFPEHTLLPRTYGLRVRRASANVSDVRLCRLQRNAGVAH